MFDCLSSRNTHKINLMSSGGGKAILRTNHFIYFTVTFCHVLQTIENLYHQHSGLLFPRGKASLCPQAASDAVSVLGSVQTPGPLVLTRSFENLILSEILFGHLKLKHDLFTLLIVFPCFGPQLVLVGHSQ